MHLKSTQATPHKNIKKRRNSKEKKRVEESKVEDDDSAGRIDLFEAISEPETKRPKRETADDDILRKIAMETRRMPKGRAVCRSNNMSQVSSVNGSRAGSRNGSRCGS